MNLAYFQFHPDLDYFLRARRGGDSQACPFEGNPSVKHLIEALGVPHTEVGLILAQGQKVNFDYHVHTNDHIDVYPFIEEKGPERNPPSSHMDDAEPHFVLDNHLGKLTTYLRMLGFDALYQNDLQDDDLVEITSQTGRILLTRDRRLLMHKVITSGYCLRSLDPEIQVSEVLRRFDLDDKIKPFHRCLRCNAPLQPISKEMILHRLEPLTKQYFDEFRSCPECERIYWKGSHYERMLGLIDRVSFNTTK